MSMMNLGMNRVTTSVAGIAGSAIMVPGITLEVGTEVAINQTDTTIVEGTGDGAVTTVEGEVTDDITVLVATRFKYSLIQAKGGIMQGCGTF